MEKKKKIFIQGAMDIEVDYLLKKMKKVSKEKYMDFPFYEGILEGHPVVLCKTGMGILNGTLATVAGIEKYQPDLVLNQGTAGGHMDFVHRGDLLLVQNAVYLNGLRMPLKGIGEGSNSLEWTFDEDIEPIASDERLMNQILETTSMVPYEDGTVFVGTIGSGDIYSRETDRIEWIRNQKNNLAEDMETYGVFATCEKYNIPAVGLRIISNHEIYREPFEEKQATNLQKYLVQLLKTIEDWNI